jgi:adenosine deaminase CECR1
MMKGLFNYESAFRRYTRECLEEFIKDNVQYAEIRPNFMPNNQIYDDEGKTQIDNFGTMRCIIEEYERFMEDIGDMEDGKIKDDPQHRPTFSGMKVIYCTPRSFSKAQVRDALNQCIEMKQEWPNYIAGFDLVGEEAYAEKFPLAHFMDEFTDFKKKCEELGLDIPFLFHCGETPDDLEGNLDTALALGSKRVGHGYALPKKPDVLEGMKKNDVCVEVCPISNMVLGLAKRMHDHSMYTLLDKELHCALSSDNGTLFK